MWLKILCNEMCRHFWEWRNSENQHFPGIWMYNITKSFQMLDKLILMEKYEKFNNMVSDSTLQWTFKKLPLFKFQCSIKDKYTKLSEKAIRIVLSFPTVYLCEPRWSSYPLTKSTYCNALSAQTDIRIQQHSTMPHIKEI